MNTLQSFNWTQIAQDSREFFMKRMVAKDIVSTDFSSEVRQHGETVRTRMRNVMQAKNFDHNVGEYSIPTSGNNITSAASFPRPAGRPDAVSAPAVDVKLDHYWGVVFGFKPTEVAFAGDLNWLKDNFMAPAIDAMNQHIMGNLLGTLTEQTWLEAGGSGGVKTINSVNNNYEVSGDLDTTDVAALGAVLSGRDVPEENRSLLVDHTYYEQLIRGDIVLPVNTSGTTEALRRGMVEDLLGFKVYKIPFLSTGTSAIQITDQNTGSTPTEATATSIKNRLRPVTTAFSNSADAFEVGTGTATATTGNANSRRPHAAHATNREADATAVNRTIHGIALHKGSAIFVGRSLDIVTDPTGIDELIVDPVTGFTLILRAWFSRDDNEFKCSLSTLYGISRFDTPSATAGQRNPYIRCFDSAQTS